ncbi:hypothetical protein ABZ371_09695, partial [Streptomyces sp. NPDC005899]|uniref:hypothetical protein n=1 Tax=Streptomyces sp. NPDC005899 TaxID=3155716 RepID=UPI0033C273B7
MKYKSEAQIMKALGIESWRNLSKDKMVRFAAMMPNMDTEVALKIVEQFPAFKDFAKDAVSAVERAHESTLSANSQSQEHVHRAWQEVRDIRDCKTIGVTPDHGRCIDDQRQRDRGRDRRAV